VARGGVGVTTAWNARGTGVLVASGAARTSVGPAECGASAR
jgi:hypothetical protein